MGSGRRRPKGVLTAEQECGLWVGMLLGQISQAEAVAEAGAGPVGDHPVAGCCPRRGCCGVAVVEAGPAAAVSPGGGGGRCFARRGGAAPGGGGRAGGGVGGVAGKIALGMSGPVPARAGGAAKAALPGLVGDAASAGWTLGRACAVLELDRGRLWRWRQRCAGGRLDDARPGGRPIHGVLEWEEAEVLALFAEWGDTDRSHRKLAHRGSREQRVRVSPSEVDRVLARHGLALKAEPRPAPTPKAPWPAWREWRPNQPRCWDASQPRRCTTARGAYAVVDAVSANGSLRISPPTPTRPPPGSCSPAPSTTRGSSPTTSQPASQTPAPSSLTTTMCRCFWRSPTTAPTCAPTTPAGSRPCAPTPPPGRLAAGTRNHTPEGTSDSPDSLLPQQAMVRSARIAHEWAAFAEVEKGSSFESIG